MIDVLKMLNAAKKNEKFNLDILVADGDKPPGFFANNIDELIYTTAYYGWLVGKYGSEWRGYI